MNARWLAALAITTGLIFVAPDTPKAAADSLASFGGSWSGAGSITLQDGSRERLRCRSTNKAGGSSVSLNLRCASDSYKFELTSDISSDGGTVSGSWNETTRGVFGQLSGRMAGGRIEATASAVGFEASLLLTTHGNSLSVSIRSPGSEIQDVTVSMARAGR